MLADILPYIIGSILGLLAGIGVGGGSLLMLWLTLIIGMEHETARTINLLFFIPAAVISSLFRRNQGSLHLKRLFPAMLAAATAALMGSLLKAHIPIQIIKKLFGILMLFAGFRELTYRPRKAR